MSEQKQYVFIEANTLEGVSEKSGKPYSMRKVRFADPVTFENHQLDFAENTSFMGFKKGDRVYITTDLQTQYNRDSRAVVTGLKLADKTPAR